jgi:hypothetical protein
MLAEIEPIKEETEDQSAQPQVTQEPQIIQAAESVAGPPVQSESQAPAEFKPENSADKKNKVDEVASNGDRRTSFIAPSIKHSFHNHEEMYKQEMERKRIEKFHSLSDIAKVPNSHASNTVKEDKVLEYVENFRLQYARLFPARKELLLSPPNEVGVKVPLFHHINCY